MLDSAQSLPRDGNAEAAAVTDYNRPRAVAAMVAMCQPGGITLSTTSVLLGGFVDSGRFTGAQAASLGSGELLGMTLGLIVTSVIVGRVDRRWYALLAILLAVGGHLLTIRSGLAGSYLITLEARFLAGLGEGAVTGVGVAAVAGLLAPDRGFGFCVTGNLIGAAIIFAVAPRLEAAGGVAMIVAVIAGYSLLFALAIPFLPRRAAIGSGAEKASRHSGIAFRRMLPGLLALGGTLLFLTGIGVVWPLAPQIGIARGVDRHVIASALATAGLGGAGAGLIVGWLGTRFGRLPPLVFGTLGVAAAMLILLIDAGAWGFALTTIALMIWWIFSSPYYYGAMSAMDVSGRLVTVSFALQTFGLALGQALAAWIISFSPYSTAICLGAVFVIGAVVVMITAIHLAGKVLGVATAT